jgi:TPR repeat protein
MANTHVRSAAEIARLVRAEQGGCGESAFALYKHYAPGIDPRIAGYGDLLLAYKYLSRGVELHNPKAQYQMGKNHRTAATAYPAGEDGDVTRATALEGAFALFLAAAEQGAGTGTVQQDS